MEESDPRKELARQRTSSSSTEITEEQLHTAIFRVLGASWKKESSHQETAFIYLPETAENFLEQQQNTTSTNTSCLQDLISQALMEILLQIANGLTPKRCIAAFEQSDNISLSSTSPTQSPLTSPIDLCPTPNFTPPNNNEQSQNQTTQAVAIYYLTDCYGRVSVEERNHPKKSSIPPLSDVLYDLRAQIIQYTSLVLKGYLIPLENSDKENSPLLTPLLQQKLPRGFINELVGRTFTNLELFNRIFTPILEGLFKVMLRANFVENEHRNPIQTLSDLTEIRPLGGGNVRPICRLLIQLANFSPETSTTHAVGRELSRISYLGPFLSVSVFAEDEPKVAEKFFSGSTVSDVSLIQTLQLELENTRIILHKTFHDILANASSRDIMLQFVAKFLKANEKRTQLQVEERMVAGDGFMLNLLSVLQMLAVKVKLDKVDLMYPFHPNTMIDIKNDTRLKFTSQEIQKWLDDFSK